MIRPSDPNRNSLPGNSLLARSLEPFAASLWILFVLMSMVVALVWGFGIGEGALERWISNADLLASLVWMLGQLDFAWITLGAVTVYTGLVGMVGLGTARRWALLVLAAVVAVAWLSVAIGFPLGHIRYGSALGMKLGPVPIGLPLFWFVIIIGARTTILRIFPHSGPAALALGVGAVAFITDLNLEFFATKSRGFWFWSAPGPDQPPIFDFPVSGSLAWGVVAAVMTFILRELSVVDAAKRAWQPIATLAIFETILLGAHVVHRLTH
jgi:uncharacterized membrane protein